MKTKTTQTKCNQNKIYIVFFSLVYMSKNNHLLFNNDTKTLNKYTKKFLVTKLSVK